LLSLLYIKKAESFYVISFGFLFFLARGLVCRKYCFGWFLERRRRVHQDREMDGKEMSKWACNRGGKAVWWGLFRVWFGLVIEREREIGRESKR